ncbi:MAG: hypothetical protein HQ567_20540, partial [Candidatus Nealsonbacteria bacterium]|nr:hypothetical protein [Candidatus Nealsonbacteria bacterium]
MRNLIAACVVLGSMAAAPASAQSILDALPAGSIYADATYGVGGTTINKLTLSVDDYIKDPAVSGTHDGMWIDDGFWTYNNPGAWGNGGIDAAGLPGGASFYSNDPGTPAPVLTTTATGLDPGTNYDVFL